MPESNDFAELKSLNGVEIFATGKWNGDNYTQSDLQDMVDSFIPLKGTLQPYVKLGHNEKQPLLAKDGLPAAGWIENIYIQGNKLMADIKDMPKTIYELVKNKAYKRISSEIYWNLKDQSGQVYKRALKAIALLGGDTPAVGSLADVQALYTKRSIGDLDGDIRTVDIELFTRKEIEMEEQLKAQVAELTSKLEAKEKEFADIVKAKADLESKVSEFEMKELKSEVEKKVVDLINRKKLLPAQKQFAMDSILAVSTVKSYTEKMFDDSPVVKMFEAAADVVNTEAVTVDEKVKAEEVKNNELGEKVKATQSYADAKKVYSEGVK